MDTFSCLPAQIRPHFFLQHAAFRDEWGQTRHVRPRDSTWLQLCPFEAEMCITWDVRSVHIFGPQRLAIYCAAPQVTCDYGKPQSQRDKLTLHQPLRLRPQGCIQRCISQKAYHFLGQFRRIQAQRKDGNTRSNTRHTHTHTREADDSVAGRTTGRHTYCTQA